jgi:hypothetical protein
MHLRYAQPLIPVYLSRAKDIKDAFKVCPTPDPCLVVESQRHMRFPGVPRTKSSILLTINKNSPGPVEGCWITHNLIKNMPLLFEQYYSTASTTGSPTASRPTKK